VTIPNVVSRAEWLAARREFLIKEKDFTRARDALSSQRRTLPMVAIDKEYAFAGPKGTLGLLDLFEGRQQLIVYHFMFDPDWDEGCPMCSFLTDNLPNLVHLRDARNTSLVLVSRAPLVKITPFKQRMGWTIPWYSSFGSDFNYDFHVTQDEAVAPFEYNFRDKTELQQAGMTSFESGEQPGLSVFLRDGKTIFHTYSTYARGLDLLLGTYNYLDLTPLGRQEDGPGPNDFLHHDRYGTNKDVLAGKFGPSTAG
jgi:predicted dithiol-disulfide oxidoreductase (DUF899 family)